MTQILKTLIQQKSARKNFICFVFNMSYHITKANIEEKDVRHYLNIYLKPKNTTQ